MTHEDLVVNGIRTHISISGSGKPLLLVHGLGGPQMWDRVTDRLAKSFQVIVVDLPGFGQSDCPPDKFSTDQYAEFLELLVEEMKIGRATVAGISYGGQIAVTFAQRSPERVQRLILVASTGMAGSMWIARTECAWKIFSLIAKQTVLRSRVLLDLFSRRSFYDIRNLPGHFVETFYTQIIRPGKREAWLNGLRNVYTPGSDFGNLLSEIKSPALIIWGKEDRAVPVRHAYEFQRLIPNSGLKIFSECAHSVPLEQADNLCEMIEKFAG